MRAFILLIGGSSSQALGKILGRFVRWFRRNRCRLGFHAWIVTGAGKTEAKDRWEALKCSLCGAEEMRTYNPWNRGGG